MLYKIIYSIVSGEKNTRFLLRGEKGRYYSAKLPTGNNQEGDFISGEKLIIEEAKERWVKQYENRPGYPRKKLLDHLNEYKENVLGCHYTVYIGEKEERHIFLTQEENLVRDDYYGSALKDCVCKLRKKGKLRDDFRFMTSSQAFAVNFFTPLMTESRLSVLGPFCDRIDNSACDYEVVKDNEEETQFDFYMPGLSGHPSVSVEVKYSENKFGEASGTEKHKWKYDHIYKPCLDLITCEDVDESEFYEFYQIWRNIIYHVMESGQHICFLFPSFRSDLKDCVEFILSKCKENIKPYIHVIFADTVVDTLIEEGGTLGKYYKEFKRKYLAF